MRRNSARLRAWEDALRTRKARHTNLPRRKHGRRAIRAARPSVVTVNTWLVSGARAGRRSAATVNTWRRSGVRAAKAQAATGTATMRGPAEAARRAAGTRAKVRPHGEGTRKRGSAASIRSPDPGRFLHKQPANPLREALNTVLAALTRRRQGSPDLAPSYDSDTRLGRGYLPLVESALYVCKFILYRSCNL